MELAGIAQEHNFPGYQAQAALLTAFLSTFRGVNPPFPLLSKQRGHPTNFIGFLGRGESLQALLLTSSWSYLAEIMQVTAFGMEGGALL